MKFRNLVLTIVLLGLVTVACTSAGEEETAGSINAIEDVIASLQQQGITVTQGDQIEQPFFSVPAVLLNLGETAIQVFEYSDESSAVADAEQVAPDGSSIGTSMPFWVEDPHFYQSGKLIVLYLGSDEAVLGALEAVFGPQFAGR